MGLEARDRIEDKRKSKEPGKERKKEWERNEQD